MVAGKHVLIVADGGNHLKHKLAVTNNSGRSGTVVGVLVLEAIVLLVHTDHILQVHRGTLRVCAVAVEILDVAQAVAAKGKLIRSDTESDIADVEGLLTVVGGARI